MTLGHQKFPSCIVGEKNSERVSFGLLWGQVEGKKIPQISDALARLLIIQVLMV